MADTRFTALGMSGSGKTCYVLGMYYEMCVGVRKFNLVTTNSNASLLEEWMDKLDDETGMNRFPSGTALTEVTDYSFKLNYENQYIFEFDWMDYGGGTLKQRENNPKAFDSLNKSIEESTALYIFIDGELLAEEDYDKQLKNVQRKAARTINSYITNFAQANEGYMPPIVFVITKSDLCAPYLNEGDMQKIIKEAFSPAFGQGTKNYIVAVSLGKEISDDDYSGEVEPINIHVPFFLGIYHEFFNYCRWLKQKIEQDIELNKSNISYNNNIINKQNNRFFSFLRDNHAINQSRKNIINAEQEIEQLESQLKSEKRLLFAVVSELDKMSSKFITFVDGKEVDFSHDEIMDF